MFLNFILVLSFALTHQPVKTQIGGSGVGCTVKPGTDVCVKAALPPGRCGSGFCHN
jgi:hypothetical protein